MPVQIKLGAFHWSSSWWRHCRLFAALSRLNAAGGFLALKTSGNNHIAKIMKSPRRLRRIGLRSWPTCAGAIGCNGRHQDDDQ